MKKINKLPLNLIVLCALLAFAGISTFASSDDKGNKAISRNQESSSVLDLQKSPFDFSDKFYEFSGVEPSLILNRKNGADKQSVLDYHYDSKYRNVRIIKTLPAYDYDGSPLFFNNYGELYSYSFMSNDAGRRLANMAERSPIYVFPSRRYSATDRQSPMFDTRNDSENKNPLRASVVLEVEFTYSSETTDDKAISEMIEKNGEDLDGTPVIRTTDDLMMLLGRGFITIRMRGYEDLSVPSYMIAPVIKDPTGGAIRSDAYLSMVVNSEGKMLSSEEHFQKSFGCLKDSGKFCESK